MSVKEKLDAFRAQVESGRRIPSLVGEKLHRSTEELVVSGQAERAKKAGDRAPTFELEDTNGRTINLTDLLVKGAVVLTFYRGVWCPYCNLDVQALEEARSDIEARGRQLVAISMQTAPNSRRSIEQNKLGLRVINWPIQADEVTMSLYYLQKFLYVINRDPTTQQEFREQPNKVLDRFDLTPEERGAIRKGDIGLIYVLGANGQLLMHFAAFPGIAWPDYIRAMREGVENYGPVRDGIYAMTTSKDEKVAGL